MGFSLALPFREVTLTRFGGLYTEADARDLPMGASPLNWDVDYLIGSVGIRSGLLRALTTNAPGNSLFQYLKSTSLATQGAATLAQSSDGALRQEILTSPGSLASFYSGILNNARALSESTGGFEFVSLSNFLQGTDQPRTYDGTNLDRVSQCAPTITTAFTSSGSGSGQLAAGTRYAVVLFVMRNGFITPAQINPVAHSTVATDTSLNFSSIPTGPSEVVARIVAVTPPNGGIGGPYYYVPAPAPTGFTSTVINDNSTTSLNATLSDAVITAGLQIAVPGNNRLSGHVREVGEYVKAVLYGQRVFYLGERVKIDNIPDLTFDGLPAASFPSSIGAWGINGGIAAWSTAASPIYGNRLVINNPSGSTLNTSITPHTNLTDYLTQGVPNDEFRVQQLTTGVLYSARIIAYTNGAGVGAQAGLGILISSTGANSFVLSPALTTTPQEFVLNFTAASIVPNAAGNPVLYVFPFSLPSAGTVYIERVEVFPAVQPVYQNQIIGSYIQDYQSVDAQTGPIGVQLDAQDYLTNEFRFLDRLYMTSTRRTFYTSTTAGSEPSGWSVNEASNAIGSLGPLAADAGEEYALIADRKGLFVFDGGNHVKISQEIQQVWEQIYPPSANQVWVKNDLHQKRILVGIPMVTPNQYLPNAPANATPSTPNVILVCSYIGLDSGAEIGERPGVTVSSFTGNLLGHDMARKWTIWNMASPIGTWIDRPDGSEQLWIGGSGTGQVYQLTSSVKTDDGNPINETYYTYGFSDEPTAEAKQLGTIRRLYAYLTATMDGIGKMVPTLFPDSPQTSFVDVQAPVALTSPDTTDVNIPINETGGRIFVRFATDGNAGSFFNLHRVVVGAMEDPKIPVAAQ